MTDTMIRAATRLTELLARENAALQAMDLPTATGLLAEKTLAMDALATAGAANARITPADRPMAEGVAARLQALAAENRRLLETALAVQGRVVGLIARALAQQAGPASPGYGAAGGRPMAGRPAAIAISARA